MPLSLRRLRQEARSAVELVLAPGLAALLPWRWCFATFRGLARRSRLYEASATQALAQAQARDAVGDAAAWLAQRRLTTLVDHADFYLERSRSDTWLQRHVAVDGTWPAPDEAGMLLTFHWGAGMWALRHAASQGLRPHALAAMPDRAHFAGSAVAYHYSCRRIASVTRILRQTTLDVRASLRPVLKALEAREQVLAVVDVPADQSAASQHVRLRDLDAQVPSALFRLAVQRRIPVTVFLAGIDATSGQRSLRIRQLGIYEDQDALVRDVYAELDQAMRDDPAAWHFWAEAPRFFRP